MKFTKEMQERQSRILGANAALAKFMMDYPDDLSNTEWLAVLNTALGDRIGWAIKHSHRREQETPPNDNP